MGGRIEEIMPTAWVVEALSQPFIEAVGKQGQANSPLETSTLGLTSILPVRHDSDAPSNMCLPYVLRRFHHDS
jgi:hypothetical protein